jgi:hypothetical protein
MKVGSKIFITAQAIYSRFCVQNSWSPAPESSKDALLYVNFKYRQYLNSRQRTFCYELPENLIAGRKSFREARRFFLVFMINPAKSSPTTSVCSVSFPMYCFACRVNTFWCSVSVSHCDVLVGKYRSLVLIVFSKIISQTKVLD